MRPLVSAIITTYKRDISVLKRAINSVINQTYKSIELIIIDDNGKESDESKEIQRIILEDYKHSEIILVRNEINKGVQKSRNVGIDISKGEYLSFLDDDDEWYSSKIEKQINYFNSYDSDNLAMVYCWFTYAYENSSKNSKVKIKKVPEYNQDNTLKRLSVNNYIGPTSFPMIKKEAILSVGCFDEKFPASQDYDLWLRLAKQYEIRCIKESLGRYYDHGDERISNSLAKTENGIRLLLLKYKDIFESDPLVINTKLFQLGHNLYRQNRFKESFQYLKKVLRNHPQIKYKIYSLFLLLKIKNQRNSSRAPL